MPVPDPPFSTPRIMKVLEPSAGQYEVVVRMDPTLASKFPDKPFGTDIAAIGLAKKDSDKYAGYTLVAIEPADKGGKDHLWVFQKLSGPEWTTTSKSKDNLTPAKYRGQTTVVKTDQEVDPSTAPTALTGDLVSSVVTQTPNTGKAVLTETTETITENVAPLVGQQFAPDGTLLGTAEVLVVDGVAAEKGVNIAQSTVSPIGNGKSVKESSTAKKRTTSNTTEDGWPRKQKKSKGVENLTPQKYRGLTTTTVTTEQVELAAGSVDDIPAPATPSGDQTVIEHEKVNDYRYEKRTITETITENAAPLLGEEYGDIVTKSVSEILVADGTIADTGIDVTESVVDPIGNGKSIKRTKRVKGGVWPSPVESEASKEVPDLTPAKYRKSVTRSKKTKKLGAIPGTVTLTGNETAKSYKQETPHRVEETTVTEVLDSNVIPLAGEEYGDIVTKTVTESLVNDGVAADTGFNVISSVVEPLGNGKSIKQTKTAKGGWPAPLTREVSKQGPGLPPERYRKDVTVTKTSKKIAAAAVPAAPTLSGDEVGKSYVKETPDRAEETTTTQTLTLTTSSVDQAKEQKPFVTITSTMTPGSSAVLPATGNGSARLVYENGATKIYENTKEEAVARPGPAGTEKDTKPFVTISTAKRFDTTNTIGTLSGSANVVFNDGATQIYEVSEVTSTGRYGAAGAEQQTKPFVAITSTATYQAGGTLGSREVGSTNKIYDDGLTTVYEKKVETATARPGPSGTEKDSKPFVTISTAKRYAADATIGTLTGSANVVFNDGAVQVYEVSEVTSTGKYGSAGVEQQTKPFVAITSTATYQAGGTLGSGEVGSTNKIYDDGLTTVYEKKVETAIARTGPAGSEKDSKPFVSISTAKRFDTSNAIGTLTGSANIVFNDGTVQVYEVSEVTSTGKYGSAGVEQQTKPFVAITSTKTYEAAGTLGSGEVGSTNKIYDDGTTIVYEKSVDTAVARTGLKGIETDAQPWGYIRNTSSYTTTSSPPLGSSTQIVYADGAVTVYEQTDSEATISGTTKDLDNQQWGFITWNGTYSDTMTTTPGEKSRQVWNNGTKKVFLNEAPALTVQAQQFTSAIEKNPLYTTTEKSTYALTAATPTDNSSSRLVYTIGDKRVFENMEISTAPTAGPGRTFNTVVEYSTPSVLKDITWYNLSRRDGGLDTLYRPVIEEGFDGFINAKVIEKFEKVPSGPTKPIKYFSPAPIFIPTPFGNLSVGPTLHGPINWNWTIGSSDPTYFPYTASYTIPATEYTTWKGVGDVLVAYKSEPFKDGFITREVYVTL